MASTRTGVFVDDYLECKLIVSWKCFCVPFISKPQKNSLNFNHSQSYHDWESLLCIMGTVQHVLYYDAGFHEEACDVNQQDPVLPKRLIKICIGTEERLKRTLIRCQSRIICGWGICRFKLSSCRASKAPVHYARAWRAISKYFFLSLLSQMTEFLCNYLSQCLRMILSKCLVVQMSMVLEILCLWQIWWHSWGSKWRFAWWKRGTDQR